MLSPRSTEVIARIDGASRGNPGPAAYGVVIETVEGARLASLSKFLGRATNNVAEYQALLAALDYALEHNHRRLRVKCDSELLARQIEGSYKVKSLDLKPLHDRARQMLSQFEAFSIAHVPREQNREADGLANRALDSAAGGTGLGPTPAVRQLEPTGRWQASATYHQGTLQLDRKLPLAEGESVELEVRRRKTPER